ncbi:MAG: STAS domain-containing protein [Planctomycetota bacterium]|jgi:anti-anti-sigma factor
MNIERNTHGAVNVLKPVGAVTAEGADRLRDQLVEVSRQSLGRIVLDFSAMPFIDSRGLEVLIEFNEELVTSGRALKLCALNDVVREVLELTELAPSFEQFEDVNSAVRSFL